MELAPSNPLPRRSIGDIYDSCRREGWQEITAIVFLSRDGELIRVILADGRTVTAKPSFE